MKGVLDFATGTASMIREKTEYRQKSKADRPSRLTRGINGGLPIYNEQDAQAQTLLREIDQQRRDPLFCVEKVSGDRLVFITARAVMVYGENFDQHLNVKYANMRWVVVSKKRLILDLDTNVRYAVTLFTNITTTNTIITRPQIDCIDESQAKTLQLMVSSVRDLYRDSQHTLRK